MGSRNATRNGHRPILRPENKSLEAVRTIRCCGVRRPEKPERTGRTCCSKSFELRSMFKSGAFIDGSNSVRTSGAKAGAYLERRRFPVGRSGEAHCSHRLQPNDGIRRAQARQTQTLRSFRLLRLLGPPQSSKPQRLLAATGLEPTLAADSVLGARHQHPDFISTKGRLNRDHPIASVANINAYVSNCLHSGEIEPFELISVSAVK